MSKVKLTRDLSDHRAGDVIDLDPSSAQWLRDNGWAGPEPDGDSHHDELSNTSASHHVSLTTAPVIGGTPQPPAGGSPAAAEATLNGEHADEQGATPFNPAEHNVEQVRAYLEGADAAERERVLVEERAGRGRAGILG